MIGDPTDRTDMRRMLSVEDIAHNVECFVEQMRTVIDFSDGKAIIVNNADWLLDLNYVEFLREIGPHFSVNRMLTAECYKQRLEKGLTFLEFNYMLMQSYDFLYLYKKYNCTLELGGDDQWSNILGGVELIRRKEQGESFGMTFGLLENSDGKKMGKTAKGAVWLDPKKTPPFDFYQYWRNVDEADVIKCMKLLTFVSLEEIAEYAKLSDAAINEAKKRLAFEVTRIVHGVEQADAVKSQAEALFEGAGVSEDMPTTTLPAEQITAGIPILDILIETKLMSSKGEGRRMITQKGVYLNGVAIEDPFYAICEKDFIDGEAILKKGKKIFHRLEKG
jgi:tyrosyl-tRNA synthetase